MIRREYPIFKRSVFIKKPEIMGKLIVVIKTSNVWNLIKKDGKSITSSYGIKGIPDSWIYKKDSKLLPFFVEDEKLYLLFKLKHPEMIEYETIYNKKEEKQNL
jgi:hypothetical protein